MSYAKTKTKKPVADISVEYAHIYTDQQFSKQHELGLHELGSFLVATPQNKIVNKVVLIDDYSPAVSLDRFDLSGFINKLEEREAKPDIVVLELSLIHISEPTRPY